MSVLCPIRKQSVFKGCLLYTNLLEKTFWSKSQSVSAPDMPKCDGHTENGAEPAVALIKAKN